MSRNAVDVRTSLLIGQNTIADTTLPAIIIRHFVFIYYAAVLLGRTVGLFVSPPVYLSRPQYYNYRYPWWGRAPNRLAGPLNKV